MLSHCVAPMSGNEKNARAPAAPYAITKGAIDLRLEWSMIIIGHASLERALIADEPMSATGACVALARPVGILDHRSLAMLAGERSGFEHTPAARTHRIEAARCRYVVGQPGRRAVINKKIAFALWQVGHSILLRF